MDLNEYQKKAMTTCTDSSKNFSYMMLNLVGEVGEFASKVAKHIRKGHYSIMDSNIANGNNVDDLKEPEVALEELKKEAGDVLWQLSGLCSVMNWNLEDVAQMNLEKLASRQKRGVIVGEGDNR